MAADDARFGPAGPDFEILRRSGTHGVSRARARRDLDTAAAPVTRRELTDLLATAAGADRVLVHPGVGCFVAPHRPAAREGQP